VLLSTIWGDEYKNDKEILWVSVARLRQKLEKDPHNPCHILTKSGVGYYMPEITI
jgi:DNA-binding response OmpR family regulator